MLQQLKLSAEEILQIDSSNPEKIFSLVGFDFELKRLQNKWHPDVNTNPNANEVFIRIMELAETAKSKIATNSWNGKAFLQYTTTAGKTFKFNYRKFTTFELGKMYIGTSKVVFVIDGENEDLYNNGIKAIKGIKYTSNKFKKEFQPLFPNIIRHDETNIGFVVVMDKPEGSILLSDLIDYMDDKILPPKHVAWVVSSLYNIAAFFEHHNICHNSILPSTIFVDPSQHSVSLLGGWWYSTKTDSKLLAVPSELIKVIPSEVLKDKKSKTSYDRLAIKGVAVGCLGDPTLVGSKLLTRKDIPKPMLNWIRMPSTSSAIEEYTGWYNALEKSFGKRKFIKLDININNIY